MWQGYFCKFTYFLFCFSDSFPDHPFSLSNFPHCCSSLIICRNSISGGPVRFPTVSLFSLRPTVSHSFLFSFAVFAFVFIGFENTLLCRLFLTSVTVMELRCHFPVRWLDPQRSSRHGPWNLGGSVIQSFPLDWDVVEQKWKKIVLFWVWCWKSCCWLSACVLGGQRRRGGRPEWIGEEVVDLEMEDWIVAGNERVIGRCGH